ncbi:MAG TPA: hypothetical protein DDX14_07195, partial [Cyanobacteria bacterium UBA9579]|nr:hypothetical protein [Cyanobacteria bacterium UBA9579]
MQNKSVFLQLFLIIFALIGMLILGMPSYANDNFIITNIISDDAGKILLVNGKNTGNVAGYKV